MILNPLRETGGTEGGSRMGPSKLPSIQGGDGGDCLDWSLLLMIDDPQSGLISMEQDSGEIDVVSLIDPVPTTYRPERFSAL